MNSLRILNVIRIPGSAQTIALSADLFCLKEVETAQPWHRRQVHLRNG